jgi:hypothetical protein
MNKTSSPNSSPHRSTELIDRYLQAVRFWMPRTLRQEDLLAELGEDLRSQIEDKEAELGHPVEKAEMAAILRRCGSPMMVAGRLGPQRHLIGPALFPIYEFVLKMVLLWILVPVFIFILGPVNAANSGGNFGSAIASTMGDLGSALLIAAGIITLVFAIIERTNAHLGVECKWDPLKLPPVRREQVKPASRLKAVCELGFGWFGLVWLALLPRYPALILGPAAAFLKAGPTLHTFYPLILALGVLGILRSAVILARPEWAWFPLSSQLANSVFVLIVLNYIIRAVSRSTSAFPFVMMQDAAHRQLAAIVNVSILLSIAATWLGVCIAVVVQSRLFMHYLRKPSSGGHLPASLGAQ